MEKKVYEKHSISKEVRVANVNLKEYSQTFQWFFYPKVDIYPDKVALYIYYKGEKNFAKRSTFFEFEDDIERFIKEAVSAEIKLKEAKYTPFDMTKEQVRVMWLDVILDKVRKKMIEEFKTNAAM